MIKKSGKNDTQAKPGLVYIMSHSYSGSTLLTYLLANHDQVSTVGELKATSMGDISSYTCSCGVVIKKCGFWERVATGMNKKGGQFSFEKFGTHFADESYFCDRIFQCSVRGVLFELVRMALLTFIPPFRSKLQGIMAQNRQLINEISVIQGGRVFLDGSKDPVRIRHLLSDQSWDIKVIYLIRDGRGVTNSYKSHNNVSMGEAVSEWLHSQLELDRMYDRLCPEISIKVVYEDLCRNPEQELRRIFNFLGLEKNTGKSDFTSGDYHILGNAMRLKSTKEIRVDTKWKTALSAGELELFEKKAGKVNKKLGYLV